MSRLTIKELQYNISVTPDGAFGPKSRAALFAKLSNTSAPALTAADIQAAARRLGVPVGHIKGSREVEAPRGSYDDMGRPTILYERHKFRNNCEPVGRFNASHPDLSGPAYGPGGYGPFAGQYDKLARACALDPEAALRACSWGAFQVLGEHWEHLGYESVWEMVLSLTAGEAAHLETYVRFIERNGLKDELQACRPNDPASCVPFVSRYNGPGYHKFNYHRKFAEAIA